MAVRYLEIVHVAVCEYNYTEKVVSMFSGKEGSHEKFLSRTRQIREERQAGNRKDEAAKVLQVYNMTVVILIS